MRRDRRDFILRYKNVLNKMRRFICVCFCTYIQPEFYDKNGLSVRLLVFLSSKKIFMASGGDDETPEEFQRKYILKKFDINLKETVPNHNTFSKC